MENKPDENFGIHAISLLKKEIYSLEIKSAGLRKKLKNTRETAEKITSTILLTKQQIDLFSQETNRALEGIKDTNWQFTKEMCIEIIKIKKPNNTLLEVVDKFMIILDQKDRS